MVRMLDWIREKMTGQGRPEKIEPLEFVKEDKVPVEYELKFYENRNGRHTVQYNGTHLCTCGIGEFDDVREYFNSHYNGDNLEQVSSELKGRFNMKIYENRVYTKSRKRKGKPGRRKRGYRENSLQFEVKPTGRVQVRVMDNGRINTICQCYGGQVKEVQKEYDSLKRTHSLDEIKVIMKNKYNLRKNGRGYGNHEIVIGSNGLCYKDGKLQKLDPSIYKRVDDFL